MEEIGNYHRQLPPLLGGPSRRKKKKSVEKLNFAESYSDHCCAEGEPPGLVDSSSESDGGTQKRSRTRCRRTRRTISRSQSRGESEDGDFGEPDYKTTAREDLQPQPIELVALEVMRMINAKLTLNGISTESREVASHPPEDARQVRRNSDGQGGVTNGLSVIQEKPGRTISIVNKPDEWVAITVTVDSGACITVMPPGLCMGIPIFDNDLSRAGVEYEVANGESIPNLGERQCQVMTVGSMTPKKITFQVAEVHKPLLSVAACSDMGFDCFLGQDGGTLKDRVTGECIPLERHGSLYSLKMWVRQNPEIPSQGFSGPD